jgi:uncharacterized protein (TIGR03792 family)
VDFVPPDSAHPPELPQDGLEVLIDLGISEGPEATGRSWEVTVVEHLRLQVPADTKEIWMEAERLTWDPWLRQQKGFVGREVLWDNDRQEGVLLIHWANRHDWKSIPEATVTAVQASFETTAREMLSLPASSGNPFPLVFAGETLVT